MQKAELENYKQVLLDMRSRLREDIGHSIDAVREEVHVPGEDTKEPSEGLDHELALERNQEQLGNAVHDALKRIEAGTYGRCIECGGEIPGERLDAVPYSPYCVRCEGEHEAADSSE